MKMNSDEHMFIVILYGVYVLNNFREILPYCAWATKVRKQFFQANVLLIYESEPCPAWIQKQVFENILNCCGCKTIAVKPKKLTWQ